MSLVNRASESVKSLASLGQVGSGVDLQALEARVDELLTAIKSGAEGIKAFQNPKQVCPIHYVIALFASSLRTSTQSASSC